MVVNVVLHNSSSKQTMAMRGHCATSTCKVVLGLADVHPVAWQREGKEPLVTHYQREGLLLNTGGAQLDAVKYLGAKDVDSSIDLIAHEGLRVQVNDHSK